MACGLATVAGNNSGYVDLMQGIGALSIVNPHDHEEFARRLDVFLHEKPLQDLWRKWAAGYVKQYSYSYIVDGYEELYQKALKQHGR
jgi:glycosyltransferase involved in cell wall biosynthesis